MRDPDGAGALNLILDTEPLSTLAELASRGASGEVIYAADDLEVHLYLQRGRLAWATDTARPLAFSGYLLEHGRIDPQVYRELVDTCLRERRPLGETLISWGLATLEDVRAALWRQIDLAIELLSTSGPVQSVFLRRAAQYENYQSALTFDVGEVLSRTRSSVEAEPITGVRRLPPPESLLAAEIVRLQGSVDGLVWAELLDGTSVLDAAPAWQSSSRVPSHLLDRTLRSGSKLVVFPDRNETLAGVRLASGRSLWCRATAETTVGAVIAALAAIGDVDVESAPRTARVGEIWQTASDDVARTHAAREFLDQSPEVHAAFVTSPSGTVLGVGRTWMDPDELAATLALRRSARAAASAMDDRSDAHEGHRLMSVEPDYLLFASDFVDGDGTSIVWIALDRACSKGLGWAHLASLARRLEARPQTQAA